MRATRNIHKIEEVLLLWSPSSWAETFNHSLQRAIYGERWQLFYNYDRTYDACRICGRQANGFFDFITLIPIPNPEKTRMEYICTDHGPDTIRDCRRGGKIDIPSPPSWFSRQTRNTFQWIVLNGYILIRFMRFFLFGACLYRLGGYKIAAWYFFLQGIKIK